MQAVEGFKKELADMSSRLKTIEDKVIAFLILIIIG
jgi:hypothetical protein